MWEQVIFSSFLKRSERLYEGCDVPKNWFFNKIRECVRGCVTRWRGDLDQDSSILRCPCLIWEYLEVGEISKIIATELRAKIYSWKNANIPSPTGQLQKQCEKHEIITRFAQISSSDNMLFIKILQEEGKNGFWKPDFPGFFEKFSPKMKHKRLKQVCWSLKRAPDFFHLQ